MITKKCVWNGGLGTLLGGKTVFQKISTQTKTLALGAMFLI
ncbi:hypothetical protein L916_05019 [Phytophthora nicotianae]|uniref:Uncharacterized protein n=1 Tax=Phytophthora nicotianae TaxID=4792 RepID=W2JG48_PHYNI|nr:hypothetical protein L916_05019 [Phytophthora nicotianae]